MTSRIVPTRSRTQSAMRNQVRALLACVGVLALVIALIGESSTVTRTDAAWTDREVARAEFRTGELGPIHNPSCLDHGLLSGLLNNEIRLTWDRPLGIHPDINVRYRITVDQQGIGDGGPTTFEVDDPYFPYIWEPSGLLTLTINFSVSPFIEGWVGPATEGTALGVSLLGLLRVELTCGIFPLLGSPAVAAVEPASDRAREATATSPTDHTTASEIATSALPNPGDADEAAPTSVSTPPATQTTTSTFAAPAIAVPDEPGELSPTAKTEDVDTFTAAEENLVVVTTADTVPPDAKQGAQALETWIGGGKAGTTWKPFTSDDPDDTGWRWAAINQKTGTVVYIR